MGTEEIVRRFLDAALKGDVETVRELVSPDYRLFERGELVATGPDEVVDRINAIHQVLEQADQEIEDILVSGDVVVTRWTLRGVRSGELLGVVGKGQLVSVPGVTWCVVRDGRLGDVYQYWDRLQLMDSR